MEYDYENYFARKDKKEHAIQKATIDEKKLFHLKDKPTLVIGAGITVRNQLPKLSTIWAGDISKKNVEQLNTIPGVQASVFDVREEWPFDDNRFDQIVAIDVFEHLGQTKKMISESRRVLKQNGLLVLGVPLLNHWKNYFTLLRGSTSGVQYDEHPRMFFDRDIKVLWRDAGFLLNRVEYLGLKGYGYYTFEKK